MNGHTLIQQNTARQFTVEQGRISLIADLHLLGDDVCVILYGGKAHIGSVTLSIPRPSLTEKDTLRATTSMLNITGHKDDEAARYVSNALAAALNKKVVVVCGIHMDDITREEIAVVFALLQKLTQLLVRKLE